MDGPGKPDDAYLPQAKALFASMVTNGFEGAVPIDPNGELLDGAHRVACALALGIGEIVVKHEARHAFAPAWGEQWFIENGVDEYDLERLRQDWASIQAGMVTT
jgi:hypothetical protein